MELPILQALTLQRRAPDPSLRTFDPLRCSPLVFEPLDEARFPLFALGVAAGRAGGAAPAAFNAANEVAVSSFLRGAVSFPGMAKAVEAALVGVEGRQARTLDDVLGVDRDARRLTEVAIKRMRRAGSR